MAQGLVTVIIPAFNYARYLRDCVDSVVRQSYAQWECLIVDDGSTDDTPAVCAELARNEPRIRVIRQTNAGLSAARNVGIRHASGDFIQFLDADDLLQFEKISVQVAFLEAHPAVDIVAGDAAYVDENAQGPPRAWTSRQVNGDNAAALQVLIDENPIMVHSALLRSRVFELVGMFSEKLKAHEDWEFWLRCALQGCKFAYCPAGGNGLALVRQHGGNMSTARTLMLDTAMAVREMFHAKLPPELRQLNLERLSIMKWRRGLELMQLGQYLEGWSLFVGGLRLSPRKAMVLLHLFLLIPGCQRATIAFRNWDSRRRAQR